jgi:hypothetical protein
MATRQARARMRRRMFGMVRVGRFDNSIAKARKERKAEKQQQLFIKNL